MAWPPSVVSGWAGSGPTCRPGPNRQPTDSGGAVGEVLHSVWVHGHGAGADQRAERDLVVAEGVLVRTLEPDPARDADLERGPLAEEDRLGVGGHGRDLGRDVDGLADQEVG